jgi:hypothetical protein
MTGGRGSNAERPCVTEELYALSDFTAHDVTYVYHYDDDPEEVVDADCTCVWRFDPELSAPPVAALRRDVCYGPGGGSGGDARGCKFGNYFCCAHGGGFVMCDG